MHLIHFFFIYHICAQITSKLNETKSLDDSRGNCVLGNSRYISSVVLVTIVVICDTITISDLYSQ